MRGRGREEFGERKEAPLKQGDKKMLKGESENRISGGAVEKRKNYMSNSGRERNKRSRKRKTNEVYKSRRKKGG